ncbi:hypothetical protein KRX51_04305 [Corynebacterium sp. TAE3-ERU12]|uniref:YkvI family membrane protein n=1 Tax=Corynebacterium sp. TAE3-ERU12 TaxID=2849491 RepID=UPI001C44A37A|nr:hypothetical protein [Corynebacterium sp. TAE3-ERU12]MBV7295141.1 hypothetical protein [Corynebacterium sp. TAE3-ERU12]
MLKRALTIAMAFVGLIIGAGFASGQETLQFFSSFGAGGLWGAGIAGIVMIVAGAGLLQLGSYFRANEHTQVLDRVAMPLTAKFLDVSIMVTLFCTGFVMFAGAGSNLEQQFNLPVWVGATLMLALVLGAGLLDVDAVGRVIGAITPFIIVFLVLASVWALIHTDLSLAEADAYANAELSSSLPNWWISALNYVGLCMIMAVSMTIVIGGNHFLPRSAGYGGLLGGIIYGALLTLAAAALLFSAPDVADQDLPMLALVDEINPTLSIGMAVVIYMMIFNTAIGMFYALGKRMTANRPERFYPLFAVACVIGYGLSFIGFTQLVAVVYPALGYIGIALIGVLVFGWLRQRSEIMDEHKRRGRIQKLARKKADPDEEFTKSDQKKLDAAVAESNVEDDEMRQAAADDVAAVLAKDEDSSFQEGDEIVLHDESTTAKDTPEAR